jgi:RimJ/RimL family protein N-acetyltransferase
MKCSFNTERLVIGNVTHYQTDLEEISCMMTVSVTKSLPPSWQGEYTPERTKSWSQECQEDGTTLLGIKMRDTNSLIGLVILFQVPHKKDTNCIDLRLGYLLSEQAWGQGFASEVVGGVVTWCRSCNNGTGNCDDSGVIVKKVIGGVALDNPASKRVLLKNGFKIVDECQDEHGPDEETFELIL